MGNMKPSLLIVACFVMLLGMSRSAYAAVCNQDPVVLGIVDCHVTDVTSLNSAFAQADADTTNTYNIYLAKKTYALTHTLILTQASINLFGANSYGEVGASFSNANQYVLDGGGKLQIFQVISKDTNFPAYLLISGLTLQNGKNADTSFGRGGCIISQNAEVDIEEAIIQNCHAVMGAGIDADGGSSVLMWTSIVKNNTVNSIVNNSCGGGAFTSGGGMTVLGYAYVKQSAFINNQACRGGGIDVEGGNLDLENSTIAQNSVVSRGGGVRFVSAASGGTLLFNTIVENKASTKACGIACTADPGGGAGLMFDGFTGGYIELRGNIVAYNTIAFSGNAPVSGLATLRDCDAPDTNFNVFANSPYFAYSTNVIGVGGSCNWGTQWGNNSTRTFGDVTTLGLNHMANAAYSRTMGFSVSGSLPAYKPLSTAFFLRQYGLHDNSGTTTAPCIGYDQRGYSRNDESFGEQCDVGSYELNGNPN